MMGLGTMPTEHPMFFGMVGNNGQAYGNRAMNQADMILLAGARVADRSIARPNEIEDNKVLVHIDVDPAEIGKNAGPSIPLVGDLKHVFMDLDKEEIRPATEEWLATLAGYREEAEAAKKAKADLVITMPWIRTRCMWRTWDRTSSGPVPTASSGMAGSSPPAAWAAWVTPSRRLWAPR